MLFRCREREREREREKEKDRKKKIVRKRERKVEERRTPGEKSRQCGSEEGRHIQSHKVDPNIIYDFLVGHSLPVPELPDELTKL